LIKLGVELDPSLFRNPNARENGSNKSGVSVDLLIRLRMAGIDPSGIRTRAEALSRLGSSQEQKRLEELRERLRAKGIAFKEPLSLEDAVALDDYGAPGGSARRLACVLGIELRAIAARVEVEDRIRAAWPNHDSTCEPATVVQKAFIRQLGEEVPNNLSRAEAAYIIESASGKPTRRQQGMLRFFGEDGWDAKSVDEAAGHIDGLARRCPEMLMAWERFAEACPEGAGNPDAVEFNCWRKYLDADLKRRMRNRSRRTAGRGLARVSKVALGFGVIIGLLVASGAMELVTG